MSLFEGSRHQFNTLQYGTNSILIIFVQDAIFIQIVAQNRMLLYGSINLKPWTLFCNLGEVISGECYAMDASSVETAAFSKWRHIAPLLLNEDIDLITRYHIYGACLQLVLIWSSETWAQIQAISSSLKKADMNTLRGITRVTYKDAGYQRSKN